MYQGIYNAMHRTIEAELLPCLRHYGMGFYAYNPLGGVSNRFSYSLSATL